MKVFAVLMAVAAAAAVQPRPDASRLIADGVAALHNFEYEEANDAFRRARAADPSRALAYWGEAMSYHQTLWRNEDVAAGRAALARLAPTPQERAAKADTPRTRALLAAVDILFGSGDAESRRRRYADAMGAAYREFRSDPDVAAFYALALLGTMSRSLIGTGDAHDPALAGSATQQRVGAILTEVLRAHPRHPGALHYLIHAYDDPAHARLALGAARAYAALAPASSHARHMPSHVFLQLGLWREAAAADRGSYDFSKQWAERKGLGPGMRNYHALSWLQYELLQRGQYREARSLIDELQWARDGAAGSSAKAPNPILSDWASMRARFALETRQWTVLAREDAFANVNDLFAIGVSAARTGDAARAETVRRALAERSRSEQEGDLRPAIAIMER
ncbi:MAG TPA: hypothetical protein VIW45_13670, partial [Vicinamibacterales bacterium]